MLDRLLATVKRPRVRRVRRARQRMGRPVRVFGLSLSRRLLIRLCRLGQVACLLMTLCGSILTFTSAPRAEAQGGCQSVCMGENASEGACTWCERLEHGTGSGGMAAGSVLVLAGLGGAISLGQLCHGLEQGGGAGVPLSGGGQQGGEYTLPDPSTLSNFLNSLGLTNADGTPIDANSVSSALDQMTRDQQEGGGAPSKGPYLGGFGTQTGGGEGGESGAVSEGERAGLGAGEESVPGQVEGETFRGVTPEGGPPQAPTTDEARNRWQLLGADTNGNIYDANHNHILNIDANGNVTDLRGQPVSRIERDPGYGTINHYVDADGNRIMSTPSLGLVNMDTWEQVDGPKPTGPESRLSGEVAARWTAVGAGPGGEMRAPDGSVIGQIGTDGTMTTHDGRPISGTSFQEGGRLSWFNTADGQHWAWDEATGQYRSSQMPDGQPFRPLSEAEWNRIDKQQAPTVDESAHPLQPGEVKPGTQIEGGEGERHFSSELQDAMRAGTKASERAPTGPEGTVGAEGEPGSESVKGEEGPRGVEGGEAEDGSKTSIREAGQGGAGAESEEGGESRAAGGEEEGGARPAGETSRTGGAESEGTGARTPTGAGAGATSQQEGARPASTTGEAPAGARPSAEPAPSQPAEAPRPAAAEGDARAAAAEPARVAAPDAEATRPAEGGGGLAGSAFNRYMDVQNVEQRYQEHVAAGMAPAEAFSLAVAQTGAGNIASDLAPIPGVTNPLSGAALSSLLPGAMSNVMPDQAIQRWVGTGYGALNALGESIGTSAYSGGLDTSAFDRFAEGVANRPGADPFSGWAQVSQLAGEESARTDGGNLVSDLQQIYNSGAGADVANEAMSSFQQDVDAGKYGAPLQGINYLTQAAAEVVADPTTTIGQFVDDVKNIYNYGPGDNFWNDTLNSSVDVIKNTPVAGTIYDGYHQVFQGIADQGLGDFAGEMAEGAYASAGEAYDAAANAAGSAYNYVRSWF